MIYGAQIKHHGKSGKFIMILLTGGTGLLGGRIAENLKEKKIDNFLITTSKANFRTSNNFLQERTKFLDLSLPFEDQDVSFLKEITHIVHLASLNSSECNKNEDLARKVKILGMKSLIQECSKLNLKKFINISTAHVYGTNLKGVINESHCASPENIYAKINLEAENFLENNISSDLEIFNLRLTNGVGSPVKKDSKCWNLIANDLCKQAITSKKISLNSSRTLTRDFIPIIAAIDSILWFIDNDTSMIKDRLFNISSSNQTSLEDIASLIKNRAENIINEEIKIYFKTESNSFNHDVFSYSNKKISKLGLNINSNLEYEIDRLLLNCLDWF